MTGDLEKLLHKGNKCKCKINFLNHLCNHMYKTSMFVYERHIHIPVLPLLRYIDSMCIDWPLHLLPLCAKTFLCISNMNYLLVCHLGKSPKMINIWFIVNISSSSLDSVPPCGKLWDSKMNTLVELKEPNPIIFIISISSSVLPCMSSSVQNSKMLNHIQKWVLAPPLCVIMIRSKSYQRMNQMVRVVLNAYTTNIMLSQIFNVCISVWGEGTWDYSWMQPNS